MQQCADVYDVGIRIARFGNRFIKPVFKLLALLHCPDVFIVLDVVEHHQVGPPVFMLPATDLLARADRVDAHAL